MDYERTYKASRLCYPELFSNENSFLHYIFFVIGTGYEWREGQIVSRKKTSAEDAAIKIVDAASWSEFKLPFEIQDEEISPRLKDVWTSIHNWYPLSVKHSLILNIPDDVKPDWLDAAIRIYKHFKKCDGGEKMIRKCSDENRKEEAKECQKALDLLDEKMSKYLEEEDDG